MLGLERVLGDGRSSRDDEDVLQPSYGVEMIAGPHHPHPGGRGVPVGVAEIVGHRVDEPAVGDLIGGQRVGNLLSSRQAAGEVVIPSRQVLGGA